MDRKILQERTKQFNVAIIKLCEGLPRNAAGFEIAKQIIRSAGSVGANYRVTARAKSRLDFIYKIQIVLEEADETLYWLEIIQETGLRKGAEIVDLIKEANELTAIFAAANKSAKIRTANQTS